MDWHHPSQYVDAPGKDRTAGNRKTEIIPEQKAAYIAYMKAQLKELVSKYDPAVLWFDGEWMDWWKEEDGQDLYTYVRGLKPDIIINNRVGTGRKGMEGLSKTDREYAGDFGTPEQQIPANGMKGVDWESCMTMNDTWGFKSYDTNWKSAETLVRNLVDTASKGGNYLLNVGPTAEGEIPARQSSVWRLSGKWMAVNGEAIYGTTASPFAEQLAIRPRHAEEGPALRARVRVAVERHPHTARVGDDAEEGVAGRDKGRRAAEGRCHWRHSDIAGTSAGQDSDCRRGGIGLWVHGSMGAPHFSLRIPLGT